MKSSEELRRENQVLRERISRLSAASLRISSSLDLGTVLQEVVDSACVLTGAQYGVITTIDDKGQPQDFVSSGFTAEEHQRLASWRDGPQLFEHLRDAAETLRIRDLPGFVRSLGYSSELIPAKNFLGTPIRYRSQQVGNFFLGGKKGGQEFTSEDEEVLVLFASQAATAIANARTHREEQRQRANLQALVDTSPVGVMVFDARTGRAIWCNQEVSRIGRRLYASGLTTEKMLEVATVRRADGREIPLPQFPLDLVRTSTPSVRAEEVVIQVPGGMSVTTMINATAIHGADGAAESLVVTLQDMAPLEELERLRAQFLSLVSHELRVPLSSIKGSATTVLDASPAPGLPEILQFFRIIEQQADHMRGLISDLLDAGHIEAGTLSVTTEPEAVTDLVDQARSTFLSGGGRHTIRIDLPPDLPRVLADRRRIVQVLNNLFSNAARLSPETLPIRVAAVQDGLEVAISVSDEGRGIPPERLPHLFRKYARVGEGDGGLQGSGLGLAICKGLVEAHGGRIRAESGGAGLGARFTFTIPVAEEAASHVDAGFASSASRSRRQGQEGTRILVVDDDPLMLRHLRDVLSSVGYSPLLTGDPQEVARLIKTKRPQLVLLDLVLPGTDGLELMESLPELADLPVIFISGYGRDDTIAKALEMGAADYIVKPFSTKELTARVQAVLRKRTATPKPFRLGDLAIYYRDREVSVAGQPVQLTPLEYDLLRALSINAGRVTTHDSLIRQVWRDREYANPRLVRTFVKTLRRKLGDDPQDPAYIHNVRGVGYRMAKSTDP